MANIGIFMQNWPWRIYSLIYYGYTGNKTTVTNNLICMHTTHSTGGKRSNNSETFCENTVNKTTAKISYMFHEHHFSCTIWVNICQKHLPFWKRQHSQLYVIDHICDSPKHSNAVLCRPAADSTHNTDWTRGPQSHGVTGSGGQMTPTFSGTRSQTVLDPFLVKSDATASHSCKS